MLCQKVKINHDITKKYKSELVTINVLELDIQLHQSRNNINRFNDLYQQAVENIKMGYKALIEWEDKLAHCELEDESECESAIELAQSIIEGAADAFENECKTLLIPINYCVEALGPKLQKSIEKERKSILNMRKRIATSLNIKKR